MPINACHYRQVAGTHHSKSGYCTNHTLERNSQKIAASLASQPPQRLRHITTVLWTLALIQPPIQTLRNGRLHAEEQAPASTSEACRTDLETPRSALPQHIVRVSCTASPALPGNVRACLSSMQAARCCYRQHQRQLAMPPQYATTARLFTLPSAQASTVSPTMSVDWDEIYRFFVTTDETSKAEIIDRFLNMLVSLRKISADDVQVLQFEWRKNAAGHPLYLIPYAAPQRPGREKRRSFKAIEEDIERHIEKNCAFETEITNSQGATEVELKLFMFQELQRDADNPVTSLFQYLGSGRQMKSFPNQIVNFYNFILVFPNTDIHRTTVDAFTEYYKRQYYLESGDDICRIRQNRLALAHIATSLEISGLAMFGRRPQTQQKLFELSRSRPLNSAAIYFARNKQTGTQTELIMTAKSSSSGAKQSASRMQIKTKGDSSYVAIEPHPGKIPETVEKPIYFDDAAEIWREVASPHLPLLNVEFQTGQSFIKLNGEKYPIRMTAHNKFQMVVHHTNDITEYIPMYRDRLAGNWHLETSNRHPIFSPIQAGIIDYLKAPFDPSKRYEAFDNLNPDIYGDGKLIKVKNKNNDNVYHMVAEMKGELVPIRRIHIKNRGIRYDAYDYHNPKKDGFPIQWDGQRWHLESWTSPHASRELQQLITPEMYVNSLDPRKLASANKLGIHWDSHNNGYLRIRKQFVQLYPETKSSLKTPTGKIIRVHYDKHQYYPLLTKPIKPVKVTKDGLITRSFSTLFEHALENYFAPEVGKTDLYDWLVSLFDTHDIEAEETPSTTVGRRRTYFSIDGLEFITESTTGSKNISMLRNVAFDEALQKYHDRLTGGKIEQILGVTQDEYHANDNTMAHTSEQLNQLSRKLIHAGMHDIEQVLERHHDGKTVRCLLVCNNDFFGTGTFEASMFAAPASTYQALVDFFIPLSKNYPEVIIAPGSIYLSETIPAAFANNVVIDGQDSHSEPLRNKRHFSAVIAPVFFRGNIIAIARKGELLTIQSDNPHTAATASESTTQQTEPVPSQESTLADLDHPLPPGTQMRVPNPDQDSLSLISDRQDLHRTIFAGKTLLPGERAQAEAILRPHMQAHSSLDLFQNEFVIDNEKFLFIIGNDLKENNGSASSFREKILRRDRAQMHGTRYDWILHASAGEPLDPALRWIGDHYLQVDSGEQNQYASDLVERTHAMETIATSDIIVHNYRRDEQQDPA